MMVPTRFRLNRSLVRSTAVMYGAAAASGALQYIVLIIVARMLGPHDLGLIILATTIGSFSAAAVEFGVGPVLVRFRPELEEDDPELWAAVVRSMSRIVSAVAAGIVGLALLGLSVAVVLPSSGGVARSIAFGFAIAAPTAALTFFQGYLQSHRRFSTIALFSIAIAVVRLAIIAVLAVISSLSAESVLAAYLATVCAAAAGAWYVTLGRAHLPVVSRIARRRARLLVLPYLRWSSLGRATAALNGRADIFLLTVLTGTGSTGVYGAASQSASPLAMLATAVGEVSFPHLAARDRAADTRGAIRRWSAWLPLLAISSLVMAVTGAYALPRLLGAGFEHSAIPFAVLVCAYGLQIWLQPIGALLYASDRQRPAASIALVQTVMVVALDLALIPPYGALGPALAILITTCLTGPLMVAAALRQQPRVGDQPELSLDARA